MQLIIHIWKVSDLVWNWQIVDGDNTCWLDPLASGTCINYTSASIEANLVYEELMRGNRD